MSEIPPDAGDPGASGDQQADRLTRTLRDHDGVVHEVRDLDPVRARVRRPRRVAPTRYVADRLIVRAAPGAVDDDALVGAVQEAAQRRGLGVRVTTAPVAGSAVHCASATSKTGQWYWPCWSERATEIAPESAWK